MGGGELALGGGGGGGRCEDGEGEGEAAGEEGQVVVHDEGWRGRIESDGGDVIRERDGCFSSPGLILGAISGCC